MKKIYLIRHAKSDWSVTGIDDIDRPLNKRGYTDAHLIGAQLKKELKGSFLFISSPAIRAISTALIIARETDHYPGKIMIDKNIYEEDVEMYWNLLPTIDDKFETVLIFGHNPTISDVFSKLSGQVMNELPTCSVSVLRGDTKNWNHILKAKFEVIMQLFPAHLKDSS